MASGNWRSDKLVSEKTAAEFALERWRGPAREEWDAFRISGQHVLFWGDSDYPDRLREISNPPAFLYYLGDRSLFSSVGVAVVGSRSCTGSGRKATAMLAEGLSESGITVVSGMAWGIDRHAHLGAMRGPGGSIAVLGTGLDVIYPPDNTDIYNDMLYGDQPGAGLVISEFAPGTQPLSRNFPSRNRIISGLSLAVCVMEAGRRSGALVTAEIALQQNREVFAWLGDGFRISEGCEDLLENGASQLADTESVLLELRGMLAREAEVRACGNHPPESFHLLPSDDEEVTITADGDASSVGAASASRTCARRKKASCPGGTGKPGGANAGKTASEKPTPLPDDPDEAAVISLLGAQSLHIDTVGEKLGWDASRVSRVLLMLELGGAVRQLPGMHYEVVR